MYHHGIISYLFKAGILSGSVLAYVEYFKRYQQERSLGSGYRESIRITSLEFGVSETTVKKAVRLFSEKNNAHYRDSTGSTMLNIV